MCAVLGVSRSGYLAWEKRPPSARAQQQEERRVRIAAIHAASRRNYGSPQVHRELREQGEAISVNTVAQLMRAEGLRSKRQRRFVPCTTDSRHDHPPAANLLNRDFTADAPNRKWVCDLTYIPTGEGWLYLAVVLDLYSRKVVGWSMAAHLRTELAGEALRMALARRQPEAGLLHHSDRGVQYACGDYRRWLTDAGIVCSMSRKGNCCDNAVAESFFSTLKTELVYHEAYATRDAARQAVFEYVEVFYNRQRRHSSLGYVSPEAFEAALN